MSNLGKFILDVVPQEDQGVGPDHQDENL